MNARKLVIKCYKNYLILLLNIFLTVFTICSLIFSNSMPEMEAIEYFLKKRTTGKRNWKKGIDYYRMDGTVLPEERNNICDSFNNCNNIKAKVFIISYKVGGLGLNMVAANRVILMDVNWNPSYETQSIFRVYRFGQMKECFVYRLVSMVSKLKCILPSFYFLYNCFLRVQLKKLFTNDPLQNFQ